MSGTNLNLEGLDGSIGTRVVLLTRKAQLKNIAMAWSSLLDSKREGGPSSDWLWLSQWMEVFLRDRDRVFVPCFYSKSRLVAVAPLYLKKLPLFGQELRFLGTGEDQKHEVCSEDLDFLVSPGYEEVVLRWLTRWLSTAAGVWRVSFESIRPNSCAAVWIESLKYRSWNVVSALSGFEYTICLQATQLAQVRALRGRSLRRKFRRAIDDGELSYEIATDPNTRERTYDLLAQIHNSSWENRGVRGAFRSHQFYAFHDALTKKLLTSARLVLATVRYREKVVGVFYGIIWGHTLYYYQSGIERDTSIKYAGAAMHAFAMRYAIGHPLIQRYALMKGGRSSYKSQYVEPGQPLSNLQAVRTYRLYCLRLIDLYEKMRNRVINELFP